MPEPIPSIATTELGGPVRRARIHESLEALTDALADALTRTLCTQGATVGVLVAGGATPLPAYRRLAARGVAADRHAHVLLSDERYVPLSSPQSNYAALAPAFAAIGVGPERFLHVDTARPLDAAADDYGRQLAAFADTGGRLPFGILGLGADGHTASLFSADDVARGAGRLAVAVQRPDGMAAVSVTPDMLARVAVLAVVASGVGKRGAMLDLLRGAPGSTAALALADHPEVELWTDAASWPVGA